MDVSWRDYVDMRIAALEQATVLAAGEMRERLAGMNEFRETLRDQATRFVTRTELEVLERDIRDLQKSRDVLAGKASQQSVNVALVISALGLILGVLGLIVKFM